MFETLDDFSRALGRLPSSDPDARVLAETRQALLTKPAGALGRLEDLAVFLAGWSTDGRPTIGEPVTIIFAGSHGVADQGVSAFPSEVTLQMVANFESGGAAINAIAQSQGSRLEVIPLDLDVPTGDITQEEALGAEELLQSLNAGANAVQTANGVVALGEMGIGNTTIAAALAASCFGGTGSDWAGPGTGLELDAVRRKAAIVDLALVRHRYSDTAVERLRCLGGREVAAIAGSIVAARHRRLPVLIDGFVVSAALAPLYRQNPAILEHCVAGHVSAEPAHARLLQEMRLRPLLDLSMRLGEGTGATLALAVLKAAAASHNDMATFDEAAVSNRSSPTDKLS
ncbi:MAG: nicotinate-nucleotide--dimethylbenzimidazole phosphoribosyltransferase [Hyphomicrobiaceae bacterium]